MALATVGNLIIGLGAHFEIRNVYMYALAYGLVGGGGNAPFIGGFHFASLFDAQGVRCAVLAAGFNIAGYFYRLLNVGPLSLEAFFYSAATFTVLLGIGISHVYPDTPYRRGDVTVLSLCPSSCNTGIANGSILGLLLHIRVGCAGGAVVVGRCGIGALLPECSGRILHMG
mmetsp:Transcript_6288/g.18872  ORF Transcript_6288/g.18872 Transcript_6288/m.18872 type:complete len:171 (+) Transcript_6288:1444-1956(+)